MGLGTVLSKKMRTTPPVRFVVISFLILILIGGLVLALPICSRSGQGTRLPDALFTSVSAVCVTGLSKFDTWVHWSAFGQVVILLLIQLGGLGIITLTTGFTLLFRQKLGLRELSLAARENLQGENLNISQLLRMILTVTFVAEGAGVLLMALRFVPQFGPYGIWLSVFHAVSAYCNAGFDIMGFLKPYGSLVPYAGDPLVMIPTYLLMLVGGLGFVVINDVYYNKIYRRVRGQKPSPLSFHSAVVLISELVLLAFGMLAFLSLEYDNTLRGMNWGDKIITAWFQSNTVRTAGFTAVDVTQQRDVTTLISLVLSFIGTAPCSTGGGIRTTTLVVLGATVISVLRGREETVVCRHLISHTAVYRALTIFIGNVVTVLVTAGVVLLCNSEKHVGAMVALQEAVAACSTIGISPSLTPLLDDPSLIALSVAMFIGRVGLVSFGLSVSARHVGKPGCVMPEARIIVG